MEVKIIPDTIREEKRTVSCEVQFTLETDVIKAPLHGILSITFWDATSVNIYKLLLEKEAFRDKKGGDK